MKSYTDLGQSCKLAEILPLESADMKILPFNEREYRIVPINDIAVCGREDEIYAWSLAALLGVLEHPRCFQGDKPTYWFCGCFGEDELYHEVEADNPVDACYKMILELHKLKMS